jgi:hypothetical protein
MAGMMVLAKTTLSAIPVHMSIALCLSLWALDQIDKQRRAFIWCGEQTVSGGRCKVAWKMVCKPRQLGGLGVVDLRRAGIALRALWEWKRWVDQNKNWGSLHKSNEKMVSAIFSAAIVSVLGSGESTLFWTGNWIDGTSIQAMAPALFGAVSGRRRRAFFNDVLRVMLGCTTSQVHTRFKSSLSPCKCGKDCSKCSLHLEHQMSSTGVSRQMDVTHLHRLMEQCSLGRLGLLEQRKFGRPRRRQEYISFSGW